MKIGKATRSYEDWLGKHLRIVPRDLQYKHEAMATSPFIFFRGTFYRWAQCWRECAGDLANAPEVLAVGDLHVENFGTWRDSEGRLVWGVNDFDEAYPLPYTNDLVRLAASVYLAIDGNHLAVDPRDVGDAILAGYAEAIRTGGRPWVLAEEHVWLRRIALSELRDPVRFWEKIGALPTLTRPLPADVRRALEKMMPARGLRYRLAPRRAGVGSLGRERYVAIAECHGGKVAREAKAMAPSAWVWACGAKGKKSLYQKIIDRATREADPFVEARDGWVVRRLAPDCSRIELSALPKQRDERRLLYAMGWETANIHLGTGKARRALQTDLRRRPKGWLRASAQVMVDLTLRDWKEWRKG